MPFHASEEYRAEIALLQRELSAAFGNHAHCTTIDEAAHRVRMLATMLDTIPVGIAIAEVPSGRIIKGNRRLEELVGHSVIHSETLDGYDEWISFHEDGRRVESHEYPLARVIQENIDVASLDVHYQCGDGIRRWMRIIGRPMRNDDGRTIAATVAVIDIEQERRAGLQQQVMIGELNHRIKNLFAVVQSVVGQTLRNEGVHGDIQEKIGARLDAYAKAHAQLLSLSNSMASIEDIAREILSSFIEDKRIRISGPQIDLPDRQAMALSMAFFELTTNAQKYGALSVNKGTVDLSWHIEPSAKDTGDGAHYHICWTETGGPPPHSPTSKGFGSFVLDRALAMQTRGKVTIDYPETGLTWTLVAPMPAITQGESG